MSQTTWEDDLMTDGFLLGIVMGWDDAAEFLQRKAETAFRAHKDDAADLLRNFAGQMLQIRDAKRREYEAHKNKEDSVERGRPPEDDD